MEIAVYCVARQCLQRRFRAEHPGRPVGLRIGAREAAEQRPPQRGRHERRAIAPQRLEAIAAIACETLVAAIARERYGHVLARELANAEGRNRRTVGKRLVVDACEPVDEIEVVDLDRFDAVSRVVAVRHLLCVARFVERRVVKGDRACIDRSADSSAIMATTALESTPPERNAPSGTSR